MGLQLNKAIMPTMCPHRRAVGVGRMAVVVAIMVAVIVVVAVMLAVVMVSLGMIRFLKRRSRQTDRPSYRDARTHLKTEDE